MTDPSKFLFKEVLPKQGQVYQEDMSTVVLCKPKLLPLKSVTLEKMEKMQREAQELVKQQEKEGMGEEHMGFTAPLPLSDPCSPWLVCSCSDLGSGW